ARVALVGPDQLATTLRGAGEELAGILLRIGVVIGKSLHICERHAGPVERVENLLRPADAGKGEKGARTPVPFNGRLDGPAQHDTSRPRDTTNHAVARRPGADDKNGVRAHDLGTERRAQWSGRDDAAIADTRRSVNDDQRQVLAQRRILETVI